MNRINMETRSNVLMLLERYGKHIKNDKQLMLLYWQVCDNINMDKTTISTSDWLEYSTHPSDILNAMYLEQAIEGKRFY